jgi:hypothetical protein
MREGRVWMVAALFASGLVLTYAGTHIVDANRSAQAEEHFGVSAERLKDDLVFKWNPADRLLQTAVNVDLFIEDGSHRTQLLLLPEQMAAGSIEYSPFTKNVSLRLVAHAADGRSTQESIRILGRSPDGSTGSRNPGILTIRVVSH